MSNHLKPILCDTDGDVALQTENDEDRIPESVRSDNLRVPHQIFRQSNDVIPELSSKNTVSHLDDASARIRCACPQRAYFTGIYGKLSSLAGKCPCDAYGQGNR